MADSPKAGSFLERLDIFHHRKASNPSVGGDHFNWLLKRLKRWLGPLSCIDNHGDHHWHTSRNFTKCTTTNGIVFYMKTRAYCETCKGGGGEVFLIFVSHSGLSSQPQWEIISSSLLNMHMINYASCYHWLICIALSSPCIKSLSLPLRRPSHRCAE